MSRRLKRTVLKKVFKEKKAQDTQVGRRLNGLMQALHYQYSLPKEKRTASLIEECFADIKEIREENRFREDFPSFAVFRKFVEKNKLSLQDLQDD